MSSMESCFYHPLISVSQFLTKYFLLMLKGILPCGYCFCFEYMAYLLKYFFNMNSLMQSAPLLRLYTSGMQNNLAIFRLKSSNQKLQKGVFCLFYGLKILKVYGHKIFLEKIERWLHKYQILCWKYFVSYSQALLSILTMCSIFFSY